MNRIRNILKNKSFLLRIVPLTIAIIVVGGYTLYALSNDNNNKVESKVYNLNLTEGFKNSFELVPDTYPPTYKLSKIAFQSNVESYGLLKWQ